MGSHLGESRSTRSRLGWRESFLRRIRATGQTFVPWKKDTLIARRQKKSVWKSFNESAGGLGRNVNLNGLDERVRSGYTQEDTGNNGPRVGKAWSLSGDARVR